MPILPVFGNINGGSSLTKSFFIKARTIKPTIANPPIIIKAYVKYSMNVFEKLYSSLMIHDGSSYEKDELFLKLLCDDINTPNAIQYLIKQSKEVRDNDNLLPKYAYNCNLIGIKAGTSKIDKALEDKINDLINQRESARKNKDFDTADKIRDEIESMGIELKDTPDGVSWKIKP